MTLTKTDYNTITACLSNEMINKLESACCAYIKELLIHKKYEDENGNTFKYDWLNIVEFPYSDNDSDHDTDSDTDSNTQHIQKIICEMFDQRNGALLWPIVSEYFVPEDVDMLRRLSDNYYIVVYHYTQEACDINWTHHTNPSNINNRVKYSNMIFKMGMSFYMKTHHHFVRNILLNDIEPSIQLK